MAARSGYIIVKKYNMGFIVRSNSLNLNYLVAVLVFLNKERDFANSKASI
jgi:hypothetical protein